ncbi:ABC transporter ATP-binding protein [Thiohalorhabdus methylotrophus]|uniref:ABC transporter ATP-binding protein n=1 Tax=Thiohalorhabdus methylotrophus TaxID=3242694 RepID=A0ABV4U141_9GAMM
MLAVYRKVLELLTPREKRQGILVLGVVTGMAVLEVAGVASVMPFLSVMANPKAIDTNEALAWLFSVLGYESRERFLVFLGVGAFFLVFFSGMFRIFAHYVMNRYIQMRRHSISKRLLETYLRQSYAFFLDRNSGDMAKGILSEVDQLIANVFQPGILAMAYAVVAIAILLLLLAMDPLLSLGVAAFIGGLYALIYSAVRGFLERIGSERAEANRKRFTTAGEVLGGIKVIKLLGRESAYLTRFSPVSAQFSRNMATNDTLGQAPKFLIEAVAIGGILALAVVLMATRDDIGEVFPILGLYAFAGYKLLPAAQNIYNGIAKLRFGAAAVETVHQDLQQRTFLASIRRQSQNPLTPKREVRLENISFTYSNGPGYALKGINLTIPVETTVGLVGGTGAGKTTLVDIVLGLLRPTEGQVVIDGTPVTDENLGAWQQALGYVPQEIFLSDATILENIAFGVSREEIDWEAVERSARMAQVHEFITQELPQGYKTEVGERGVRLSGGQRQRIGIARALYHDPEVLVLDEATSALDNVTERAVMEAVHNLHEQKTVILIAHRLSTVQNCDLIYLLEEGQVAGRGTYQNLLQENLSFRAMVTSAK